MLILLLRSSRVLLKLTKKFQRNTADILKQYLIVKLTIVQVLEVKWLVSRAIEEKALNCIGMETSSFGEHALCPSHSTHIAPGES